MRDSRGDDRVAVSHAETATEIIERTGLLRRLESPLWRLCLLQAPSGAGKTTLLRDWAARRSAQVPLLWVDVPAGVGSVATFWSLLCESAQRTGLLPTADGPSAPRVAASLDPTGTAVATLTHAGPLVVVLDGYEALGDATADIDEAILRAVRASAELRLVIAGRGGSTMALLPTRLRHDVHLMTERDLRMTESEVEAVLARHLDVVPAGLSTRLREATWGHALAVRAASLVTAQGGDPARNPHHGWGKLLAADLKAQLADPDLAHFVALSAVPPYVDAALASSIAERSDVDALFGKLERHGFGRWMPFVRSRPVFAYAEVVRGIFVHELQLAHPDAYRRAAGLAAASLDQHGDHEAALGLALAAKEYGLAAAVFVKVLLAQPERYSDDRLLAQLEELPARVLHTHPVLAFALGLARLAGSASTASAVEAFRRAARQPVGGRILGIEADRFIAGAVRAISLQHSGRYREAAVQAARAVEELDGLNQHEREDLAGGLVTVLLRQLGWCLLHGGAFEAAVTAITRAAQLAHTGTGRRRALDHLRTTHGYLGQRTQARAVAGQLARSLGPGDREVSDRGGLALVGEGFRRLDDRDPAGALEVIEKASALDVRSELTSLIDVVRLHARLVLGDGLAEARALEEAARTRTHAHGEGSSGQHFLLGLHAIAWMSAGRFGKAERILASRRRATAELVPARLVHALLTGRPDRAVEMLPGSLTLQGHTVRTKLTTRLLGAAAALRCGNDRLAMALLVQMFDLHRIHGATTHLDLLPAEDRTSLVALAREGEHARVAEHLLLGVDVVAQALATVPPLTARERVVLTALLSTASREKIAERLSVSVNTVKSQIRSIYRKLGVATRAEALSVALEHELLDGG